MSKASSISDEAQLRSFGYTQTLHRSWSQLENFASAFGALYFVGGIRILYTFGLYAGGPAALWSSYVITVPLMCLTAAVIAAMCSSVPLSGSIYIWAAEAAGGAKSGGSTARLVGFIVAFWSTTAWTSFVASNTQGTANFLLSELTVFEVDFPGGVTVDNVKFRAVQWAVSEAFLFFAILTNLLPPGSYKWIFRASLTIIFLDFVLTMIWLPIGVSQTYGFQSAKWVFTQGNNGTGAPPVWNWMLSFLFTSGVLTGFDAAGHVAEETKGASLRAARGIFWSCVSAGVLGFPVVLLFLFCSPPLEVLFSFDAPQPFVLLYAAALGRGGGLVMTIVAILGLFINTSVAIVAASRLVYAVARDGVLPGSKWIGKVNKHGQPINAVLFIGIVAGALLCTILASPVAFTSLVSAGAVPTIAAYAIIPICRILLTPNSVKDGRWSLGRWSKPLWIITGVWNMFLMAVLLSPVSFPVSGETFNYAPVIFGSVTIFGIISWFVIPEEQWLSARQINNIAHGTADTAPEAEVREDSDGKRSATGSAVGQ